MSLHGWRQLCEWSIEHSCLEADRKDEIRRDWEDMWIEFCKRIVREYGYLLDEPPTAAQKL